MKFPKLLLILAVLVLSAMGVAAQSTPNPQQRTVTKAEIDKLEADARAKLEKLSYRKLSSTNEYSQGEKDPIRSERVSLEVLRPNRLREVVDVHITYDDAVKAGLDYYHSEYVEIGDKTYFKEDKKPWKVSNEKRDVMEPLTLAGKPEKDVRREYEYLYLGRQDLNGSAADLYQVTAKTIISNKLVFLSVKKTWFDNKGRFVKIETDNTNYLLKGSSKKITEYEYDKPIKIEAPIK